jgi:hypothetical protein
VVEHAGPDDPTADDDDLSRRLHADPSTSPDSGSLRDERLVPPSGFRP